jgi:hypothetical protein
MSFNVGANTFYSKTAAQHSIDLLADMNARLVAQNLAQLTPTQSNAIWWTLLAYGSKLEEMDMKLESASQILNIATCTDTQLINLLPVIGALRYPAKPSTLTIQVVTSGAVNIVAGTVVPYSTFLFTTDVALVQVSAGTYTIKCTCQTTGPIQVPAGGITTFQSAQTNVTSVTNPSSASLGSDIESYSQLRARILNYKGQTIGIVGCINAMRSLEGINYCNVFYNPNNTAVLNIGSLALEPRTAVIVISGYSDKIAETYLRFMTAPTHAISALQQQYELPSGQVFIVNYKASTPISLLYLKIQVDSKSYTESGYVQAINNIIRSQPTSAPGVFLTSKTLGDWFDDYHGATIVNCLISTNNVTFTSFYQADVFNEIPFSDITRVFINVELVNV